MIIDSWWFILSIALIADAIFGELRRFHPLVGFGNLVDRIEKKYNLTPAYIQPTPKRLSGIKAWLVAVLPILAAAQCLYLVLPEPGKVIFSGFCLYLVIGRRSLVEHALAVYKPLIHPPLTEQELDQARERVGWIVSRETVRMTPQQVSIATIESVLENGSDSLFGAIFWFLVAGPVGALGYRLTNTLDAMWGYKTARFRHFGWAAARLDDLLNWVPARLTALSYACVGKIRNGLVCWKRQSAQCESPNGGVVMTAGAGALGIRLGGTTLYHGEIKQKPPMGLGVEAAPEDILRATRLINRALILWLVLLLPFSVTII